MFEVAAAAAAVVGWVSSVAVEGLAAVGVAMPFAICVCCCVGASSTVEGWVPLERISFGIGRRNVGGTVVLLMNLA